MGKPAVSILENAYEVAWSRAPARWRACSESDPIDPIRRSVLFIHGIEFVNRDHVVSDFFIPFEREAQVLRRKDATIVDVYVLSWDSRLELGDHVRALVANSVVSSLWQFIQRIPLFPAHMMELEKKATTVAEFMLPFAQNILSSGQGSPLVVSHSLGSFLWATVVKKLLASQERPARWGNWWNLQPAIPARAFDPCGEFADIPKAYDGVSGKQIVWYSKMDFVLGTLYRLGKKRWAMGQMGPRKGTAILRNVSFQSWDAHGLVTLRSGKRCFFRRIGSLLHRDMAVIL